MFFAWWFLIVGALLVGMALAGSVLKRLPLTSSMFYLGAGVLLGPAGAGLIRVDPVENAGVVERVTEIAVIVSLFTAGLKLRVPLTDRRWRPPILLAVVAMTLTVAAVTGIGVFLLGLPVGAAVLLGAVLAPTDPVLASDVQVEHAHDAERVRFSLTGEAGLNDGTAFPFVMLGLGLLGLHEVGEGGWRWLLVDLVWAVAAGLAAGALCGTAIGRLVLYLRRVHREAVGLDDFLTLGLIAFSYGAALLIHAYGFLAVFAAGLALRRIERQAENQPAAEAVESAGGDGQAVPAEASPASMTRAVLGFNEQLERMGEFAVVLLVGGMLSGLSWSGHVLWFIPLLFLGVRPVSAAASLLGTRLSQIQRGFIGWFGIRGIGSIYYLSYALTHGVDPTLGRPLVELTLGVVAVSIVVHGISVTPLMNWYDKVRGGKEGKRSRG